MESFAVQVLFLSMLNLFSFASSTSDEFRRSLSRSDYQQNLVTMWESWKRNHRKFFSPPEEESLGFQAWVFNYNSITDHNIRFLEGTEFYMQTFNQFADKMPQELKAMLRPTVSTKIFHQELQTRIFPSVGVPDDLNWGHKGWLSTDTSTQFSPTGWVSSATKAFEAQIYNQTGAHVKLSDQEILDCTQAPLDRSLITLDAFSYMYKKGVTFASMYPATGEQPAIEPCTKHSGQLIAKISGCMLLEPENEENLKVALSLIGPLSVSIKVTRGFFYYFYGVFYDPVCTYKEAAVNHAVLLVGYGRDSFAGDYWIIQNNWGKNWGENGFARMARNTLINCGIASAAVYPVI